MNPLSNDPFTDYSPRAVWFVAGMIVLLIASQASPQLAGLFVLILVTYLAIEVSKKTNIFANNPLQP
jgi:hypothetical protein